jgi:tetratricopeptide (TPR) repeat protein
MRLYWSISWSTEETLISNIISNRLIYIQYNTTCLAYLQRNPGDTLGWNALGIAYGESGQYDEATKAYQKALEITPNFVDSYYNLAMVQAGRGFYRDAVKYFDKVIELAPEDSMAYHAKGRMLSVKGNA